MIVTITIDTYVYSYICGEGGNSSESESSTIRTSTDGSDLTRTESSIESSTE